MNKARILICSFGLSLLLTNVSLIFETKTSQAAHPFASTRDAPLQEYLNKKHDSRVANVLVEKNKIRISGNHVQGKISNPMLAEIRPHQNVCLMKKFSRLHRIEKNKDGKFEIIVPRFTDGYDRLLSKWAIVSIDKNEHSLLSHATYATKIEYSKKQSQLKPFIAKSKKGVASVSPHFNLNDLSDLGVRHVTYNIFYVGLIRLKAGNTIEYQYAGKKYYYHRQTVANYDRLFQFTAKNKIAVSVILLAPKMPRNQPLGRVLTHPDTTGGIYSMANLTSEEGVAHYAAMISFLAQRYGGSDPTRGRITNWILHNEVDAAWTWTNIGKKSPLHYMDEYTKAMRVTDLAARAHDPHAKVFISLTHHWNKSHQPNDPRYYRGKELLQLLNQMSKAEGDFPWALAYHPYPENLFNPKTWLDRSVTANFNTPRITLKNIEVLDAWMKQPEYQYQGKPRTVILSEQGFHTDNKNPEAEKIQAAALVYAWHKIKKLDTIEAFHYHRWIDHEREGGLNLGLWTVKKGSISHPERKKLGWHIYRALGTPEESKKTEFAKKIIGISKWSQIPSVVEKVKNKSSR